MTVQSLEFTRELLRERSGVVPVFLLTLEAPGFEVARLARSPFRVISRGMRFEKSWFEIDFADERAMQCRRGEMRGGNCGVLQELCRLSPRCSALWDSTD